MKKVILLSSLCFAGLAVSGCKQEAEPAQAKKPETPVSVRVTQPKRGEIMRSVTLPATVAANQQVTLYAKVTGYLKKIHVDKGDQVKAGDLIAEIEVPELIADLAKSKAEAEIADLDFKRASEAQKKAPDLVTVQSIDAAKAKFEMAKATLDRAETLLGYCRMTAPFSGTITKRFVDPGAFIPSATPGSTAQNSALVTLSDSTVVRVQVAVPEPEVPLIVKNLPVKVFVEELPGRNFQGTVTRFAQALDDLSKTMLTEIDLENPKGELRSGMYATAKIDVEKHGEALLLPVEAVLVEKAGASVFTVADNKAKKVPVKTGFNDGAFVEILDGVSPNETVIVIGKTGLNNGQPVTVAENK